MGATYSPDNKYYPYGKVHGSYIDLSQLPGISKLICNYLLDAPTAEYTPPDDNAYPRCRFWKYLFYDGAAPLQEALPTIADKMSVLFDPRNPENPPTKRGYRLIPQIFIKPAQTDGQTQVYFYVGRTVPSNDEYKVCLAVNFVIWTHYQYEANTQTAVLSRISGIEQALIDALHGVNMTGVGTFFYSRSKHPDCGSQELYDGNTNIGRRVTLALELATTSSEAPDKFDNLPFMTPDGTIRMG